MRVSYLDIDHPFAGQGIAEVENRRRLEVTICKTEGPPKVKPPANQSSIRTQKEGVPGAAVHLLDDSACEGTLVGKCDGRISVLLDVAGRAGDIGTPKVGLAVGPAQDQIVSIAAEIIRREAIGGRAIRESNHLSLLQIAELAADEINARVVDDLEFRSDFKWAIECQADGKSGSVIGCQ